MKLTDGLIIFINKELQGNNPSLIRGMRDKTSPDTDKNYRAYMSMIKTTILDAIEKIEFIIADYDNENEKDPYIAYKTLISKKDFESLLNEYNEVYKYCSIGDINFNKNITYVSIVSLFEALNRKGWTDSSFSEIVEHFKINNKALSYHHLKNILSQNKDEIDSFCNTFPSPKYKGNKSTMPE